jgi:hypothetical protein
MFALQVPGEVGFYNAHADETRLYLTHCNITSLKLQLYNVPLANFAAALGQDSYRQPAVSLIRQLCCGGKSSDFRFERDQVRTAAFRQRQRWRLARAHKAN